MEVLETTLDPGTYLQCDEEEEILKCGSDSCLVARAVLNLISSFLSQPSASDQLTVFFPLLDILAEDHNAKGLSRFGCITFHA